MDTNLKIALVAGLGGLVGGLLSAIVAPHVNWGIEKRKQKLEYRRQLIKSWRNMITWVAFEYEHRTEEDNRTFVEVLQNKEDFFSLRPHLSARAKDFINAAAESRAITGPETKHFANPTAPFVATFVNEIARIEKEWNLV
jgi:hypothetical protein